MIDTLELVRTSLYMTVGLALAIPLLSVVAGRTARILQVLAWLSVLTTALTGLALLSYTLVHGPVELFAGQLVHDKFTSFILLGASLTAALALLSAGKEPLIWESSPGYYGLLPLALFGITIISGATDVLLILAAWLLVSVLSYVYIALPVEKESRAAAVRYILVGAVATLFLAFWAATQTVIASNQVLYPYTVAPLTTSKISGLALAAVVAALGFKLGVVPFHWWLPSVYGRADGRVVSVVAAVIKLGFIALLARLVYMMAGGTGAASIFAGEHLAASKMLASFLAVLAVLTMTYGNIAALTTRDLRGLLAYSSIAQVGYILAALAALSYFAPRSQDMATYALAAIAVQAVAYGMAKAPLFPLTSYVRTLDQLAGLLSRSRAASVSAAVLLFSLLGMPPMLGFWGKLYMFIAVAGFSILLVIIAFINSAISSAYYVRFAREILAAKPASPGESSTVPGEVEASLTIAALLIIAFGLIAPILFTIAY